MIRKKNATLIALTLSSLALAPALLPASHCAEAATFRVNNRSDLPDMNPGDGVCRAYIPSPETEEPRRILACTLRAAVMEANAFAGADTILVGRGRYQLDLVNDGLQSREMLGATGDLDIVDKLVITGKGKNVTIIDATNLGDRIFDIHDPSVVVIEGMTLTGGEVLPVAGRLVNQPVASELECPIIKPADGADGGALLNRGGVVQLNDMEFTDNIALCDGGAVENQNDGVMTITDCDFFENVAVGNGGAIENDEDSVMRIAVSRPYFKVIPGVPTTENPSPPATRQLVIPPPAMFQHNNAYENGGAIASDDALISIRSAEIRYNLAQGLGGGIWNGDSDSMTLTRTVIDWNDAFDGGGIYNNDGFLNMQGTTVENNSPNDIVDYNIAEGTPN
jgi:predicted outer membrane repeat protein